MPKMDYCKQKLIFARMRNLTLIAYFAVLASAIKVDLHPSPFAEPFTYNDATVLSSNETSIAAKE